MQILSQIKAALTSPLFSYIRGILYVAIPSALAVLVSQDKLSQSAANLWIGVTLAALSPAIAAVFAPNGWKTYVYGVVAAVQAAVVGLAGAHNVWALLVAAVLGSFATSGIAAVNVPTPGAAKDA